MAGRRYPEEGDIKELTEEQKKDIDDWLEVLDRTEILLPPYTKGELGWHSNKDLKTIYKAFVSKELPAGILRRTIISTILISIAKEVKARPQGYTHPLRNAPPISVLSSIDPNDLYQDAEQALKDVKLGKPPIDKRQIHEGNEELMVKIYERGQEAVRRSKLTATYSGKENFMDVLTEIEHHRSFYPKTTDLEIYRHLATKGLTGDAKQIWNDEFSIDSSKVNTYHGMVKLLLERSDPVGYTKQAFHNINRTTQKDSTVKAYYYRMRSAIARHEYMIKKLNQYEVDYVMTNIIALTPIEKYRKFMNGLSDKQAKHDLEVMIVNEDIPADFDRLLPLMVKMDKLDQARNTHKKKIINQNDKQNQQNNKVNNNKKRKLLQINQQPDRKRHRDNNYVSRGRGQQQRGRGIKRSSIRGYRGIYRGNYRGGYNQPNMRNETNHNETAENIDRSNFNTKYRGSYQGYRGRGGRLYQNKGNRQQIKDAKKNDACFICGQQGHYKADCPQNKNKAKKTGKGVVPNKNKKKKINYINNTYPYNAEQRHRAMYGVQNDELNNVVWDEETDRDFINYDELNYTRNHNEPNYIFGQCPTEHRKIYAIDSVGTANTQEWEERPFYIDLELEGYRSEANNGKYKAVMDTGSNTPVISEKYATDEGFTIYPLRQKISVHTAGGSESITKACVLPIVMHKGKRKLIIPTIFYVLNNLQENILLDRRLIRLFGFQLVKVDETIHHKESTSQILTDKDDQFYDQLLDVNNVCNTSRKSEIHTSYHQEMNLSEDEDDEMEDERNILLQQTNYLYTQPLAHNHRTKTVKQYVVNQEEDIVQRIETKSTDNADTTIKSTIDPVVTLQHENINNTKSFNELPEEFQQNPRLQKLYQDKQALFIDTPDIMEKELELLSKQHEITEMVIKFRQHRKPAKYIYQVLKLDDVIEGRIKCGTIIDKMIQTKFLDCLYKHKERVSTAWNDTGKLPGITLKLDLKPNAKAFKYAPYKTSYQHQDEIESQTKQLLEAKFIRESNSNYASPVLMVPKKKVDGVMEWRMCIDYRMLNSMTIKDLYPLPNIQELYRKFAGKQLFSSIDLRHAYHHIEIREEDKYKTAFITHQGLYEWNRMTFGFSNAPAAFQRALNYIFKDLEYVIVYLDDILILSNNEEEHIEHIETVFNKLEEYNLKIRLGKCLFFQKELKYLGFILNAEGVRPDPEYIQKVMTLKEPQGKPDLLHMIGMIQWLHRYIPRLSDYLWPLTRMTKKGVKFLWDDTCKAAFSKILYLLKHAKLLRHPDLNKKFYVVCDASDYGIGAALMQEYNGVLEPCEFFSSMFSGSEMSWHVSEKELAAIVRSLEKWSPYLLGKPFHVYTDHKNLEHMECKYKGGTLLNKKLIRWLLRIEYFDFICEYIQGSKNVVADALSRQIFMEESQEHHAIHTDPELLKAFQVKFKEERVVHYINKYTSNEEMIDKECIRDWDGQIYTIKKVSKPITHSLGTRRRIQPSRASKTRSYRKYFSKRIALEALRDAGALVPDTASVEPNPASTVDVKLDDPVSNESKRDLITAPLRQQNVPDIHAANASEVLTGVAGRRVLSSGEQLVAPQTPVTEAGVQAAPKEVPITVSGSNGRASRSVIATVDDGDVTVVSNGVEDAQVQERFYLERIDEELRQQLMVDDDEEFTTNDNQVTDTLGRTVLDHDFTEVVDKKILIAETRYDAIYGTIYKILREERHADLIKGLPAYHRTNLKRNVYQIYNNLLFHTEKQAYMIPPKMRHSILHYFHGSRIFLHQGQARMYALMKKWVYWRGMHKDIVAYIQYCESCSVAKQRPNTKQGLMQIFDVQNAFEVVHLDIVGPLPCTKNANKYILTMMDRWSRMVKMVPLPVATANAVANAFRIHWVYNYGVPVHILTDRGTEFKNALFQVLTTTFGINALFTTSYHPRTNGRLERFHRYLKERLRVIAHECSLDFLGDDDWDQWIPNITFSYNITPNRMTKYAPYKLIFGRRIRIPMDNILEQDVQHIADENINMYHSLRDQGKTPRKMYTARQRFDINQFDEEYQRLQQEVQAAQDAYSKAQKMRYDESREEPPEYLPFAEVYIETATGKVGNKKKLGINRKKAIIIDKLSDNVYVVEYADSTMDIVNVERMYQVRTAATADQESHTNVLPTTAKHNFKQRARKRNITQTIKKRIMKDTLQKRKKRRKRKKSSTNTQ